MHVINLTMLHQPAHIKSKCVLVIAPRHSFICLLMHG